MARTKSAARKSGEGLSSSDAPRGSGKKTRHYYRPGVEARKETRTYDKQPNIIVKSLQNMVKDMAKECKETSVKKSAITALQQYLKSDMAEVRGEVVSYKKVKHVLQDHCEKIVKEEELNQLFRGVSIMDDDILPGDQRQM